MTVQRVLWLCTSVQLCLTVAPGCQNDRESLECYDAIEGPLAEIGRTAVKIPVKLTLNSARDPYNTFRGAVEFMKAGGRSSMAIFIEAVSTLSFGMEAIVERNDPGAASSELVMFAAQAVRLLITNENITDNPLLKESIASITPELLHVNRQALKVVNRIGGPRRYFFLPVLYLNDVALNFLWRCKTSDNPPEHCDMMQNTILKALDVVQGLPLIVRTFGRPLKEFLTDEE